MDLDIRDFGQRHGYRVVEKDMAQFEVKKDPRPLPGEDVSWRAIGKDAWVVILADSPFDVKHDTVLHIPAGQTKSLRISGDATPKQEYEYAVLVRDNPEKLHEYIYVRGANSPPGVIVGP